MVNINYDYYGPPQPLKVQTVDGGPERTIQSSSVYVTVRFSFPETRAEPIGVSIAVKFQ